jgi:hypothetical protein
MASIINPNNIDGTYPVAGQDNDSQGFRDNFTNTKTNFERARDEITDLQNNVVLKAALSGTVLNNNMNGARLSGAELLNMSETRLALGSVTGSVTINYASAPYQTMSTTGPISLEFSNFSAPGTLSRLRLQIDVTNLAHTLTLPSVVSVGIDNIQGSVANIITFNRTGKYEFEFVTNDQGGTITVFDLNRNHDPIYLPSAEVVADGAAASLVGTASTFSTDGSPKTATLAAGIAGQIKVLAMTAHAGDSSLGDMVVTITNAGWKDTGTGTATFSAIGQACTLMYINSKWFCIGNNGAEFD